MVTSTLNRESCALKPTDEWEVAYDSDDDSANSLIAENNDTFDDTFENDVEVDVNFMDVDSTPIETTGSNAIIDLSDLKFTLSENFCLPDLCNQRYKLE